jgi:hypothetical protein
LVPLCTALAIPAADTGSQVDAQMEPDRWEALRIRRPPVDPTEPFRAQLMPDWKPASGPHVKEFQFASAAPSLDECLWDFYLALVPAGYRVRALYKGSKWEAMINCSEGGGTDWVPSVSTQEGPSINWKVSRDGKVYVQGAMAQADAVRHNLRRSFQEYTPVTQHSKYTGKGPMKTKAAPSMEEAARMERAQRIKGKVLVVEKPAVLFTTESTGIWDLLEKEVGTRSIPPPTATPWKFLLRTATMVSIQPDGKIEVTAVKSDPAACQHIEQLLLDHFEAKWHPEETWRRTAGDIKVRYGTKGWRPLEREASGQLFR